MTGKRKPPLSAQENRDRVAACTALDILSQAAHQASVAVLMGDGPAKMIFRLDEIDDMVKKIRNLPRIR
jgi:hypothetical protein